MNITPKHNTDEFNKFLFQKIDLGLYCYKYLKSYIDKVVSGQLPMSDLSIINTLDGGWILILHGEVLHIYGDNWQPAGIGINANRPEYSRYKNESSLS